MKIINKLMQSRHLKIAGFTGRTLLSLGGIALVSSCMQSAHIPSQEYRILTPDFQDTFDIPPPPEGAAGRTVQLWSTSYFTKQPVHVENGVPFRDINGVPISDNVSKRDWCLGAQEGSIKTTYHGEEIRLNHAGAFKTEPSYYIDCRVVFNKNNDVYKPYGKSYHEKINAPFGLGIYNYFLVPYRTLAVELGNKELNLKRGDIIYIKEVTKNIITDPYTGRKSRHDGYFFVGDKGGDINGEHIDTFCGFIKNCLPPFTDGDKKNHVLSTALVITDPTIKEKLTRMHLKSSYR